MSRTFGRRIQQFVMSNDIMDEDIFEDLMKLISRYLEKDLGITHFSLLMEGIVDNKPGLDTKWSMSEAKPSLSLPDNPENGYENYSTYAFGRKANLWMVCDAEEWSSASDAWKDLWSRTADVPTDDGIPEGIRTSIRHPIKREGLTIGVLELSSDKYTEPTPVTCEEIERLGRVVERACRKKDIRKAQRANTRDVIEQLGEALDNETWTRLALPQMFVAYSAGEGLEGESRDNHKRIVETIQNVVKEFDGILETKYWDESAESGNISLQVIRQISLAEYGICYFSEPDERGECMFNDNPNVLFEAGMMQALQNSSGALLRGWIPIRQQASPDLPFDIASERILSIDSFGDDVCNTMAEALRTRIETLLGRQVARASA